MFGQQKPGGMFGSQPTATTQPSTGLFRQQQQPQQTAGFGFGQQAVAAPATNAFSGFGQQANQPKPAGIFDIRIEFRCLISSFILWTTSSSNGRFVWKTCPSTWSSSIIIRTKYSTTKCIRWSNVWCATATAAATTHRALWPATDPTTSTTW